MNRFKLVVLGVFVLFTTGCGALSLRAPVTGALYQDTKAGELVTEHQNASKKGEACATSILGWVGTGDASIHAAAREGGISKIAYVDSHSMNILGIYAKYCTIVRGE
ncbi:MAG TPA: TRL-like family protein [Fredinandcohnia sp.]|nr:TRL-like family protein [Fredinandcohnia sp.]